jgi:hypothetical protein
MVDWDYVDRRRAKGWDWDRIAEDPKAGFHAEADAGDPGRALRALYYQRRSKGRRAAGDSDRPNRDGTGDEGPRPYSLFARIGLILAPLFGIWFVLALVFPSPVGTYLAAVPWIGLLLAVGALVLAYGMLKSTTRWAPALRTSLVIGIILGFCVAGAMGGVALIQGCPTLTSTTTGMGSFNWEKAKNPEWTESGVPVFFFYGSIACPYCSASSWAMANALMAFGNLMGTSYGSSNPGDVYPNTPEVILASATLTSQYVALHVDESTNPDQITTPATPSCIDTAYVSSYDSTGSIPYVVVGGLYIHVGQLVDPGQMRVPQTPTGTPLTPQQVQGEINNQSGPAWNAVSGQMYFIEALIVHLNNGQPSGVAANPIVQQDLKQIS